MENVKHWLPVRVKERVVTALQPRRTAESQNAWNLYGDIAWWGVLNGVVTSFLSVFTIRLGGSDMHVGLLSALPALVAIFFSIPGSRMVEREHRPLSVLLLSGALNRAGYLAVALVPFVLLIRPADTVVLLVGLLSIPGAVASVAFTTMFSRAVAPENRARVVSIRNVWVGITSTAAALLGGKLLDVIVFPINYQILFALAFAASMVSIYYLSRIQLPPAQVAPQKSAPPRRARDFIDMLRANPGFVRFTRAAFIFHWGMFFAPPLYSIYWVRVLNASDGWVGLINMVGSATTIIFYAIWGRLSARRGNRFVLILTTIGLVLYPLFTALSPSVEWILVVSFLGGVFSSGFALALFNGLLEVVPEYNRSGYIAAYTTLINVTAFISPILSTSLAEIFGIRSMLIFGALLRLVGSFMFWPKDVLAREPRTV